MPQSQKLDLHLRSLEPSSLSRKNSFSMILGHSDIGLLEEDSPNYESQDREETNNSARDHHYTSAHHIELLAAKKASARKMVTCLENEISDLKKRNCLIQFFYCYEINTKLRKVQALKNLLQCRSYPELVEAAMQASTVTRVNRSWRTSRTRDLLDEIIYQADAEDLAIVDEHRSLISKKEKLTAKIR
jgi:myosin heavy subunit